jgi:hypothetical protein
MGGLNQLKTYNMNSIQQENVNLKRRLAFIQDDLKVIIKFINDNNLSEAFRSQTGVSDECWHNISNIKIACNLDDNESDGWLGKYYYCKYDVYGQRTGEYGTLFARFNQLTFDRGNIYFNGILLYESEAQVIIACIS